MQIKERGFTENFYLRKGENVYSFLRVAVLIWHLSIIERVRKKERMYTFEKTTVLVWQTNSTNDNFFLQQKSMIIRKVLFTFNKEYLLNLILCF